MLAFTIKERLLQQQIMRWRGRLNFAILDFGSTQKLPDATRVSGLPKRAQVEDRSQTSKTNRQLRLRLQIVITIKANKNNLNNKGDL